jgi:hypothetical protein
VTRARLHAWLAARQPAPPAELHAQLALLVDAAPEAALAGDSVAEAAGALGVATLGDLVRRPPGGARRAMELLAADAFVTYAFEAAAEDGRDVTELAQRLLAAVAAVAAVAA